MFPLTRSRLRITFAFGIFFLVPTPISSQNRSCYDLPPEERRVFLWGSKMLETEALPSDILAECDLLQSRKLSDIECEVTPDLLNEIYDELAYIYKNATVFEDMLAEVLGHTRAEDSCRDLIGQNKCKGMINGTNSVPTSSYCTKREFFEPNSDDPCSELVQQIRKHLVMILREINCLAYAALNAGDDGQLAYYIKQNECLKQRLKTIIGAVGPMQECYEEVFNQVNTCFALQLREKEDRILELTYEGGNRTLNLIKSNIMSGNRTASNTFYMSLKTDKHLDEIVADVYKCKGFPADYNCDNFAEILRFAAGLRQGKNITQRGLVYSSLMKAMSSTGPFSNEWVTLRLFVETDVNRYCNGTDLSMCYSPEFPNSLFAPLRLNIARKAVGPYDSWVSTIRQNKFAALVEGVSPFKLTTHGDMLSITLPDLVKKTYNKNPEYLGAVLDFIGSLNWNSHRLIGMQTLYDETRGNITELLRVAIKLKDVITSMRGLSGPDGLQGDNVNGLLKLKDNLPASIFGLVWAETCTFKSNGKYLTSTSEQQHGDYPFNMKVKLEGGTGENTKWTLTRINQPDNKFEFQLKSKASGNYLGQYLPSRWHSTGCEYASMSEPNPLQVERSLYNFEVSIEDSSKIRLLHVGRKALLARKDNDVVLALSKKMGTFDYSWEISCT